MRIQAVPQLLQAVAPDGIYRYALDLGVPQLLRLAAEVVLGGYHQVGLPQVVGDIDIQALLMGRLLQDGPVDAEKVDVQFLLSWYSP